MRGRKRASTITIAVLMVLIPVVPRSASANGGDQRVVEGTYLVNLSRSPFTPRAGEMVAFLISFARLPKSELVTDDLIVQVKIAKLGAGSSERRFLFEQHEIPVEGGVLELPYTFSDPGLHEVFVDFALAQDPTTVHRTPDFLLDVQAVPQREGTAVRFVLGGIVGLAAGLAVGGALRRKPARAAGGV